jgi:hypothetical protein
LHLHLGLWWSRAVTTSRDGTLHVFFIWVFRFYFTLVLNLSVATVAKVPSFTDDVVSVHGLLMPSRFRGCCWESV